MSRTLRGPRVSYPLGGRVDRLVARWASATPDATALLWRGSEVTYRELVGDARRVAGSLAERGIQPGDIVAVRLSRNPSMVAVLLGVLMTGAAYAGASPQWPLARFRQIVAATGARLSIEDSDVPDLLRGAESGPVPGDGSAACSVFFTSGTSGTPRAVLSPHLGTARIALDPMLDFRADTRILHISPLGWDAPSVEMWGPLINGGSCDLFDGTHPTSRDLAASIARGTNTVFLTTSLFNAIVDEDLGSLSGLRHLMTGGERISPRHVSRVLNEYPGLRLSHVYGPVESTIFATGADLRPGPDLPIGSPMANTGVHLIDGEIAISGDGLALEYLGAPEETAASFVTLRSGERAYLTGDRATVGEDGLLRFLGRADRQFKLRGVRIDPAEIEAAMAETEGVRRAAVVALPLGQVAKRESVGFFVGDADPQVVRKRLASLFPAACVPGRMFAVEALPLNANGKVDAARLAELAAAPNPGSRAARTGDPRLNAVVAAAADLLECEVGADSDLLALGADSIVVIRLASRLRETGVTAGLVLAHRTPRLIAEHARPDSAPRTPPKRSPLLTHGIPTTQYRMWYLSQTSPSARDLVNPLLFQLDGPVDVPALRAAVRTVVRRHAALRTRLVSVDDKTIEPVAVAPDDVPDLLETDADLEEFFSRPFDLPFRAALTGDRLAFAVHHTAYDGWSEEILCRELSAAYAGTPLPPAPLGFQDAARMQREQIEGRIDADFWLDHLRGVPDLPLHSRKVDGPGPLGEVPVRLPAIPPEALRKTGATATAFYLAAWIQALRAASGSEDFAVGMPMAGRIVEEASDVIGCFASSAVLRFAPSADSLVDRARSLLERVLTDQFVPLERLYWELRPEPGRNPFCQAGFVVQHGAPASLPDLPVTRLRVPQRNSMFELALVLWPGSPRDCHLWYRTDLFPAGLARDLAAEWARALAQLLTVG